MIKYSSVAHGAEETALAVVVGRPKGSTNKRKRLNEISLVATKNEIVEKYVNEKKRCVREKLI